jgi:hypothetical protein
VNCETLRAGRRGPRAQAVLQTMVSEPGPTTSVPRNAVECRPAQGHTVAPPVNTCVGRLDRCVVPAGGQQRSQAGEVEPVRFFRTRKAVEKTRPCPSSSFAQLVRSARGLLCFARVEPLHDRDRPCPRLGPQPPKPPWRPRGLNSRAEPAPPAWPNCPCQSRLRS